MRWLRPLDGNALLANMRLIGYSCCMAINRLPNGMYQHDYRVDEKRRYKRFRTKAEAQAHELEVRNAKAGEP